MKNILEFEDFIDTEYPILNEISTGLAIKIIDLKFKEKEKELKAKMSDMTPEQKAKANEKLKDMSKKRQDSINKVRNK